MTGSSAIAGSPATGWSKSMSLPGCTAIASGSRIDVTEIAPAAPPDGHSRRAVTYRTAPSASVDSASSRTQLAVHGTTASGTISSAANGG